MRISIIGTGYVGLVTGACLSERGHDVVCVDVDPTRVAMLNRAATPIFEEGLETLLHNNVGNRLKATGDLEGAVQSSEITFIAVGTPFDGKNIDLTAVLEVARQIGTALARKTGYHVVVVKSTVVPGTTEGKVVPQLEAASGKKAGADFGVGMNPEFLSEGEAVHDFMFPDRIVIGGIDERSIAIIDAVYASFPDTPRIKTNPSTAELIKYASNALLANLISFANEISNVGSALGGIDATDVMRGVHLSHYFMERNAAGLPPITSFLYPGCGFGGSCLPKDVKALIAHGRSAGEAMPLLEAVIRINEGQPARIVALLQKHWPNLQQVRVTVLGLSFKPGTGDLRESPAFPIMHELLERGAVLKAHDPVATQDARTTFARPGVTYCDDLESALADADAVVVVTPWNDYRKVPGLLRDSTRPVIFVDARRAFEKGSAPLYDGVGL